MNYGHKLFHLFQPIICLDNGNPYSYEALLRSPSEPNPQKLFKEARKNKSLHILDTFSISKAIDTYTLSEPLFLNIFPSTLLCDEFIHLMDKISASAKVVLEINESDDDRQVWEHQLFKERLMLLNASQICWALDDVGRGQASLHKILEYQPNYIKFDRYFGQGLSKNPQKQSILSYFIDFCSSNNIGLILEGIEIERDYIKAKELGIKLGQGYYFGKPSHINRKCILSRRK